MTNFTKNILYLGSDDLFLDKIRSFFVPLWSNVCIMQKSPFEENWAQKTLNSCESYPHLIFIDFYNLKEEKKIVESIISFILLFKKQYLLRGIPIVGLFASKEDLRGMHYLLSCGISYVYIKRENHDTNIFNDSRYLAFEENIAFPEYAIASRLDLKYQLSALGTITAFDNEYMAIEADIPMRTSEIFTAQLRLFNDNRPRNFEVAEQYQDATTYDYQERIVTKIPYPGPWDSIDENSLLKDTVDTWIENNREDFKNSGPPFLIISKELRLISDLHYEESRSDLKIFYRSYLNNPLSYLQAHMPSVIVFELETLDPQSNEPPSEIPVNDTNMLMQIIRAVKTTERYTPLIIVFNGPSGVEAMKKAFNYNSILPYPAPLEMDLLSRILTIYRKKGGSNTKGNQFFIPNKADLNRIIDIKVEVTITSITEHELTFFSTKEIPFYSILKIDQPKELYLTIIPPFRDLKFKEGHHHYMGIIMGHEESDLELLRRFVNQIIFKKPTEFKYIEEQNVIPIKNNQVRPSKEKIANVVNNKTVVDTTSLKEVKFEPVKRIKGNGRSKL